MYAVAIGDRGTAVLVGCLGTSEGGACNGVVIKLDRRGQELWQWEDDPTYGSAFKSLVVGDDNAIIVAGHYSPDGITNYVFKLDAEGDLLWEYKVKYYPRTKKGTTPIRESLVRKKRFTVKTPTTINPSVSASSWLTKVV